MSEQTRAVIYRALLAVAAAAVGIGWITDSQATAIIGLLGSALLGNGLATRHTSLRTVKPASTESDA